MNELAAIFQENRIIPVLTSPDIKDASSKCEFLLRQGFGCVEITLRSAAALDLIKQLSAMFPELCVGAGTILTVGQADIAIGNGARFLFSPGFNPHLTKHCVSSAYPYVPGCATAGEIQQATDCGCLYIKLFPINTIGGVGFIRTMSSVFPDTFFIPSGGITGENVDEYLALNQVPAVCGSWLLKEAR